MGHGHSLHKKDYLHIAAALGLGATGAGLAGVGPLAGMLGGAGAAGAGAAGAAGWVPAEVGAGYAGGMAADAAAGWVPAEMGAGYAGGMAADAPAGLPWAQLAKAGKMGLKGYQAANSAGLLGAEPQRQAPQGSSPQIAPFVPIQEPQAAGASDIPFLPQDQSELERKRKLAMYYGYQG